MNSLWNDAVYCVPSPTVKTQSSDDGLLGGEGQGEGFDLNINPTIGRSANFSPKCEEGQSVYHGNGFVVLVDLKTADWE